MDKLIKILCDTQEIKYSKTIICPNCNNKSLHITDTANCSKCGAKWVDLFDLHSEIVENFEDKHSDYIKMMEGR